MKDDYETDYGDEYPNSNCNKLDKTPTSVEEYFILGLVIGGLLILMVLAIF